MMLKINFGENSLEREVSSDEERTFEHYASDLVKNVPQDEQELGVLVGMYAALKRDALSFEVCGHECAGYKLNDAALSEYSGDMDQLELKVSSRMMVGVDKWVPVADQIAYNSLERSVLDLAVKEYEAWQRKRMG